MTVILKVIGEAPQSPDMPAYPYLARHKTDHYHENEIFVVTDYQVVSLTKDGSSWVRGTSWPGDEWKEHLKKNYQPLHPVEVVELRNHPWTV